MARLSDKEIRSIYKIKDNEDFKSFMGIIEKMYSEACGECCTQEDEVKLRKAQGAAKRLEDLLEFVRNSHENLNRVKDRQKANA